MTVKRKGRIVKLGASAEDIARRADRRPRPKGKKPAIAPREKQTSWNWYLPDGSIKKGQLPIPGENCEKIPETVIYPENVLRYCNNPACPSAQGENIVEGNKTIFVAGTPAVLYQETVAGKDGTYSIAYFCPVCRTYQ